MACQPAVTADLLPSDSEMKELFAGTFGDVAMLGWSPHRRHSSGYYPRDPALAVEHLPPEVKP